MAKDNARVEIYTDVAPDGDIVIEDWGTGIEDYQRFKQIAIGSKAVNGRVSSYEIVDENIIGQKGLGKLSFLNLSSIATAEERPSTKPFLNEAVAEIRVNWLQKIIFVNITDLIFCPRQACFRRLNGIPENQNQDKYLEPIPKLSSCRQ